MFSYTEEGLTPKRLVNQELFDTFKSLFSPIQSIMTCSVIAFRHERLRHLIQRQAGCVARQCAKLFRPMVLAECPGALISLVFERCEARRADNIPPPTNLGKKTSILHCMCSLLLYYFFRVSQIDAHAQKSFQGPSNLSEVFCFSVMSRTILL